MSKTLSFLTLFIIPFISVAQPEINCDTIHDSPSISNYVLPYLPGSSYTVTQSNCHPTGGHYLTFAYDFNTNPGDTIIACRAGEVTFANDQYADTDWTSGHENNVFIRHADGTIIRYTHLQQGGALVTAGQQVEQGQVIGLSGNSGNTGGFPHLHLAAFNDNTSFMRQNTIPMNFCNTEDPVNAQNLLIGGQSYTALDKNATAIISLSEPEVSIYPNPVSDFLQVKWSNNEFTPDLIQLIDTKGQTVFSQSPDSGSQDLSIAVKSISSGLFYVVLKKGNQYITRKIIVTN